MGVYEDLSKLDRPSPAPLSPVFINEEPRPTKLTPEPRKTPRNRDTAPPSRRDTRQPSTRDATTPRYHDATVEEVRKAVKEFGKEAATHRFTIHEKKAIADIVYSYRSQGARTSENEIARIAINFIVCDFKENGKNSFLDLVMSALNR